MDDARADPPVLVMVCLRHADGRPDVDPVTGQVHRDPRAGGLSAADEAALEHALGLADAWGARVLAVCAGPPAAAESLRRARAVGAEVLLVPWPPTDRGGADPLGTGHGYLEDLAADPRPLARALLDAVAGHTGRTPSLVLCGDRSADRGTGALPAALAHELAAAQALGLIALVAEEPAEEPAAARARALLAQRRLDGGRRERLRVRLPAVCSVEAAGVRLRRAGLAATIAAAGAPVPLAPAPAVDAGAPRRVRLVAARPLRPRTRVVPPPAGDGARERLLALTGAAVSHEPPTVLGPLDAPAAADALLEFLRRHGYLERPVPGDSAATP